jgi:hypothetical protein
MQGQISKLLPMEHLVNELLERSAVKAARSVLRGGWRSDPLALPAVRPEGLVQAVQVER